MHCLCGAVTKDTSTFNNSTVTKKYGKKKLHANWLGARHLFGWGVLPLRSYVAICLGIFQGRIKEVLRLTGVRAEGLTTAKCLT